MKRKTNLGEKIRGRIKGYPAWAKLPKKILKKHSDAYIVCPDLPVEIPKALPKVEQHYTLIIKLAAETRPALREAVDHVISCLGEDTIVGDKRFELCRFKESFVKIGMHTGELTCAFRLRQLSSSELKKIKTIGG